MQPSEAKRLIYGYALRAVTLFSGLAALESLVGCMIGFLIVNGVFTHIELLESGKQIGTPVKEPNGELIKAIRRFPQEKALPISQSVIYGTGTFPLHTDTVY